MIRAVNLVLMFVVAVFNNAASAQTNMVSRPSVNSSVASSPATVSDVHQSPACTCDGANLYDFENRLTQLTAPALTMNFAYNGDGHRMSKTVGASVTRVVEGNGGELYYSWTHYGTAGRPSFVRIR